MSNLTQRGPYASRGAKLPALQAARAQDPAVQRALEQIREWLEVRLGARGDRFERAVTFRDLAIELEQLRTDLSSAAATSTTTTTAAGGGDWQGAVDALSERLDTLTTNAAAGTSGALNEVAALRADLSTAVRTLIDAATIAVDASQGFNFRVVLGGNRTLGNPTGMRSGQQITIRIKQDGTGSRTLAYGSKYKFPGGTVPVLSTAANALDMLICQYDPTDDTLACVMHKAFA